VKIGRQYLDDTSPAVRRALVERWRAMTPAEKGAVVSAASRALFRAHVAGLALRHPGAVGGELERLAAESRLGRAAADEIAKRSAPPAR